MSDFFIEQLKKELSQTSIKDAETESVGRVEQIADGIVILSGLNNVRSNEMVALYPHSASKEIYNIDESSPIFGLALNLKERQVDVVLLSDSTELQIGDFAKTTQKVLEVPVGEQMLGHIVNPLGVSLENKTIGAERTAPIERNAPDVISRKSVHEPLQTGIKAIDAMIPIGRGQRELIIGGSSNWKNYFNH